MTKNFKEKQQEFKTQLEIQPEFIFNPLFLDEALPYLGMKFKAFPEELKNNPLFITSYFSKISSNNTEYKFIPKELLNNPFFIYKCLIVNPDLYLIIDNQHKTTELYEYLYKHHHNSILKYVDDKKEFSFYEKIIRSYRQNYAYAPEHIKADPRIYNFVFQTNLPNHFSPEILFKYFPEELKSNPDVINKLVNNNISIFPYLPEKYLNDKTLCLNIIGKNSLCINYVSENLRSYPDWVETLIQKYYNNQNAWQNRTEFKIKHILFALPLSFYNLAFCQKFAEHISSSFEDFPISHRSNQLFIETAFEYLIQHKNNEIPYHYLNYIGDEELKKGIKAYSKEYKKQNNKYLDANEALLFIKQFHLNRKLHNELNETNSSSKKIKI